MAVPPPILSYVLSAHGASDFEGCSDELVIPDNIILQYFFDPTLKDSVICMSTGGERRVCEKQFPMRQEYQFTSQSPIKPPDLVLFRLDDNGTNTGFYECHSGNWISAGPLGDVAPNVSGVIDMSKVACLSTVLLNFSNQFKTHHPGAIAGIYIAVCSTPWGHSLPPTSIYTHDPSTGARQTLAEFQAAENAEVAAETALINELVALFVQKGAPENRALEFVSTLTPDAIKERIEMFKRGGKRVKTMRKRKTVRKRKQKKTRKH